MHASLSSVTSTFHSKPPPHHPLSCSIFLLFHSIKSLLVAFGATTLTTWYDGSAQTVPTTPKNRIVADGWATREVKHILCCLAGLNFGIASSTCGCRVVDNIGGWKSLLPGVRLSLKLGLLTANSFVSCYLRRYESVGVSDARNVRDYALRREQRGIGEAVRGSFAMQFERMINIG